MATNMPRSTVRIRSIRTADRDELAAFYDRLSPDSRFARFHAVTRGIGGEAARLLCGPDHEHREGFIATPVRARPGDGRIVGHLCLEPGRSGIEMAIAVADDWQRHGVGRALLEAAVGWARIHGITRLEASMLVTNGAFIHLIESVGGPTRLSTPSAGIVLATIDVGGNLPTAA